MIIWNHNKHPDYHLTPTRSHAWVTGAPAATSGGRVIKTDVNWCHWHRYCLYFGHSKRCEIIVCNACSLELSVNVASCCCTKVVLECVLHQQIELSNSRWFQAVQWRRPGKGGCLSRGRSTSIHVYSSVEITLRNATGKAGQNIHKPK